MAEKFGVTREDRMKWLPAARQEPSKHQERRFKEEIVPVTIKTKKGEKVFDTDEFPREGTTMEVLAKLRPAFKKGGTVTAGNASG